MDTDRDPWGPPYRIVRNKLGSKTIGCTQGINVCKMSELLIELFPFTSRAHRWQHELNNDINNITINELECIIKEISKKRKVAPGIDGIRENISISTQNSPYDFFKPIQQMPGAGYFSSAMENR